MTITFSGTITANGAPYPIILDADYGGGWASLANEATIGALPTASLTLGMRRYARGTGIEYALASLTPGNGFANGTWGVFSAPAAGSWTAADVVAVSNITLSGEQTIDGFTTSGSRVLVTGQTTQSQNGIYTSAAGAWTRTTDANSSGGFAVGKTIAVVNGTTYAASIWIYSGAASPTIGTTSLTFAENAPAGSAVNLASPPPIGNVAPNTGAFSALTLSGAIKWAANTVPAEGGNGVTVNDVGTPTTLTGSQYNSRVINLLGTLTAQRTAFLPLNANAPYWIVRNSTTGGFSVAVGGATGSTVTIAPNTTAIVWTDGTNYYGVSGGGSSLTIDATVHTASVTATAGTLYKFDLSGGAVTQAMPSSPNEGDEVAFCDTTDSFAGHNLTLTPTGASVQIQDPYTLVKSGTSVKATTNGQYVRYRYIGGTAKYWMLVE